jgi:FkbM family methyltransferase
MPTSEPSLPDRQSRAPSSARRVDLPELAWRVARALPHRERRTLALRLLETEAEELTFHRKGIRWTTFAWDHVISPELFIRGSFQGSEVHAVLDWMSRHGRFASSRDVIVDVGAHIGTSTIPFAQGRSDCRVVAIEPVPKLFRLLCRNVADNGLAGRVTCVQAAIGPDGPGRAEMILSADNSGAGELRRPGRPPSFVPRFAAGETVEVPTGRLADILATHGVTPEQVAFVWSDTQGGEPDVIGSGAPLWATGVPLFAELDPRTWGGAEGTARMLSAATAHFGEFLPAETLIADERAEPRPIAELGAFCAALRPEGTDALLLPAWREPSPGIFRSAPP